jgi:hypothetical protein
MVKTRIGVVIILHRMIKLSKIAVNRTRDLSKFEELKSITLEENTR